MKRRQILTAMVTFAFLQQAFTQPVLAETTLKIGVTAGPAAEILEKVVPIAKKAGLNIRVYEFQDYIQPNVALDSGDLDANIFQTRVFLEDQNRARGFNMRIVGTAFTLPMAFYSKKVRKIEDLPKGATVGIPNDASMGGRALILLETGGIIKIKEGKGLLPTRFDIEKNPKNLKFVELDAAHLPKALDDLTTAAVNGNYAAVTGLNPLRDGILVERSDGPYVCNIVVDQKNTDAPWVKPLVKAYQDPSVAAWIRDFYKGTVIPGF